MTSVAVLSKPPFGLKTMQKDPNFACIQSYDIWGGADHLPRRNLLLATDALATQNVTVTAEAHTLYLQGTGSVALSGTGSGTLQGTGANDRVTLAFTPTAGTLTLTVSGTVTFGMLCKSSVTDRSYQKITDWASEQYAWAAQKNVPWLRRNRLEYTNTLDAAFWTKLSGATITTGQTDHIGGTTAVKLTCANTATNTKEVYKVGLTQSVGSVQYGECKFKAGEFVYAILNLYDTSNKQVWFNLSTGAVGTKDASITASITSLGDDWYLCKAYRTVTGGTNLGLDIQFSNEDNVASFTGIVGSGIYAANPLLSVGETDYQRIATTWPAEYTALALAAGYPISLYSDRAGTTATVGPDDPVGVLLDQSEGVVGTDALGGIGNPFKATGDWTNSIGGGTFAVSGGKLSITYDTSTVVADRAFTVPVSGTYAIQYVVSSITAGTARILIGTSAASGSVLVGSSISSAGTYTALTTLSSGTTYYIDINKPNAGTATFDTLTLVGRPGYTATAPSVAGSPTLRLDGNGKFYLDRDTTDDNLPITWPAVLSDAQLGPELVTNGGFTTDASSWTLNAGWSYADGKISITATSSSFNQQVATFDLTKKYILTVVVSAMTAGDITLRFGSSTNTSTVISSAGTKTFLLSPTVTGAYIGFVSATATCSVDSISVREVTGTNVIYTATGDYTTKDSGLILSGATDYKYPQRPSGDYGRIVMASESKYDAKIIKYLDAKRGRSYQLGPELVTNGDMSSSTGWTLNLGYSIGSGVLTASGVVSSRKAHQIGITTSGKSYLVTYSVSSYTSGNVRAYLGGTNGTTRSAIGTYAEVLVMGSTDTNAGISANTDLSAVIDNVSVREILL